VWRRRETTNGAKLLVANGSVSDAAILLAMIAHDLDVALTMEMLSPRARAQLSVERALIQCMGVNDASSLGAQIDWIDVRANQAHSASRSRQAAR
jgi:hypothetical protein